MINVKKRGLKRLNAHLWRQETRDGRQEKDKRWEKRDKRWEMKTRGEMITRGRVEDGRLGIGQEGEPPTS